MVLGDPFRGLFRWRAVWLAVTAAGVAVFGFFGVAAAIYPFLAEDPVFGPGELPALFATLAGSLGLAVLGACCLRVLARRLRTAAGEDGFGAWLPRVDAADRDRRIDFGAETVRLRRFARRAAALVLVWAALAGSGVTGLILLDKAADRLLATGARVYGVVVSVRTYTRGGLTMQVRYGSRTAKVVRDSDHRDRAYHVGEVVTVIFDRADPERVRTTEEANENQFAFNAGVVLLVAGFGGAPFAVVAAVGWRRRARAVAGTGWRVATVDVVPDRSGGRNRRLPEIRVRYRDGTAIVLRAARSTHRAKPMADYTDRLAWIGGRGPDMVVLFPNGPSRPGPYAVPASAIGTRDQLISPVR
jgi:hypothetical protein